MAFPNTPLGIRVEILINGVWTSITSDVYARDGLEISRGSANESAQVEPSRAAFTLNNRDGDYSSRNPSGAYYGYLGRNTRGRISLIDVAGAYLRLNGAAADMATTPDSAPLSITGDIDIRLDIEMDSWRSARNLAGKYRVTGDQRSWVLQMNTNGTLSLAWTTAGTLASRVTITSTLPVPVPASNRRAVRVTLDVNNGAAGHTGTFYYADTIAGSWTQLGDVVITSGVTSIFDSTSPLEAGMSAEPTVTAVIPNDDVVPITGRVRGFQLLSGIAGSAVANPDFTIQTVGAASFADTAAAPNTWTIAGTAALDDRNYRLYGEVPEWPVRRDATGSDVYVSTEFSGILRRISREAVPLRSTMYRALVALAATPPLAYWPCEDASGSTSLASGLANGKPMSIAGGPQLATSDLFPCSEDLPEITNSIWTGTVPAYATSITGQLRCLLSIPAAGITNGAVILRFFTTGTARRWDLVYLTASSGSLQLQVYDGSGTLIATSVAHPGDDGLNGDIMRVGVGFDQSGADIGYELRTMELDSFLGVTTIGTIVGQTAGHFRTIVVDPNTNVAATVLGHISVHSSIDSLDDIFNEFQAYDGETAGRRIERLCGEEEITFRHSGSLDDTEAMGVQRPNTLMSLLREAADADAGILYEPRDVFGLGYRPRTALYNQEAVATLDYASNELAEILEPTDDDLNTRNDVTATRTDGSSARYTLTSGALSILDPPNGVGVYDEAITVNVETDSMLPDIAAWRVHTGTVNEPRYPEITVDLANSRIAADAVLVAGIDACDVGDRLTVQNPPSWLPPGDINQLVRGYTETLNAFERRVTFKCDPISPYTVASVDDADMGRADTAGSELVEALTTTETDMDVKTTTYPLWTTSAPEYPFDLAVGGEVVTATACTSSVLDTFTRAVADGWGTPNVGAAWTNSGGAATEYDVTGSAGTHTMTSVSLSRWSRIDQVTADFDLVVDLASNDLASGGSQYMGLTARAVDINNLYNARVAFTTTATVVLSIRKRVAGVETELGTFTTGLTHVANTFYRLRFDGVGTRLRARIWALTAVEVVSVWDVQVTDSALTAAGSIGVRTILDAANTDVNPVVSYDNFASLNPQTFTVTRSVNGIVKAQSSGTDVRLDSPATVAL